MSSYAEDKSINHQRLYNFPLLQELSQADFTDEKTAFQFLMRRRNLEYIEDWARDFYRLDWQRFPRTSPWLAPVRFEEALEEAPDRDLFLEELQNIIDVTLNRLALSGDQSPIFRDSNQVLAPQEREELRVKLLQDARYGCHQANLWLEQRRQKAWVQLLDYVREVVIVPHENPFGHFTRFLTVCRENDSRLEEEQFTRLSEYFARGLPADAQKRQLVLGLFSEIANFQLDDLETLEVAAARGYFNIDWLAQHLPVFRFPRFPQVQEAVELTTKANAAFWNDFHSELATRVRWAKAVCAIIAPTVSVGSSSTSNTQMAFSVSKGTKPEYRPAPTILDEYLTSRLSRKRLDLHLESIGMIGIDWEQSTPFALDLGRQRWRWSVLRSALKEIRILRPLDDQKVADALLETYNLTISRQTIQAYSEASLRDRSKRDEYDKMLQELIDLTRLDNE